MFSKLFLLFGIFWVTEAVHAVLDNWWLESLHEEECNTFTEVFFRFASGCNLLRGLFIFLAFCCKTTIWQSFKKADRLTKIKVQSRIEQSGKEPTLDLSAKKGVNFKS